MKFPEHPNTNEVLIDPHSHSKHSDGLSTPRRMFQHAKQRGLRGLIITDHDTVKHWEESMEAAQRTGMATAAGVEVSTAQGHILAYFEFGTSARSVARSLKLDQGVIHYLDAESVIRRVHDLGGVLVIPHPFGPFYPMGSRFMDKVDGIEEYNSWIFQDTARYRNAFEYAKKFRIAALGGSDSHYPYTVGFGATAVPADTNFAKPDWLLQCILHRKTRPIVQQRPVHRRINFVKSTVSIPLNMRYNAKFFRSKWQNYWRQNYRELLQRGLFKGPQEEVLTGLPENGEQEE